MKVVAPKKLIELALPLDDINREAAREKSIRHGHPSTLHLWWARRPLAAARAVLFAQMVNAPGWRHELDGTVPSPQQKAACTRKKNRLFDIIRELVKWENSNNGEVLAKARAEIAESWRETCECNKGVPGFDPGKLPAFHDPFAGGGAIPLEAQRLGLESHASDLNPVAVMINKAMIEIPPKFAGRVPVGPVPQGEVFLATKNTKDAKNGRADCPQSAADGFWPGVTGLAEDVRRYGHWMREEAKKRIGHLYPKVRVTAEMAKNRPDLAPYAGRELTVIAWLWARTVKSPNPAFSGCDVPLVSSFILSSKPGKEAWVEPVIDGCKWHFEVRIGKPPKGAEMGTTLGKRKAFRCVLSNSPIDYDYIREFGKHTGLSNRMFAVVLDGPRGRIYINATPEMETLASTATPAFKPSTLLPDNLRDFKTPNYGLTTYGDLFTDRQLVVLDTFSGLVQEAREKVKNDSGDEAYANAVATYLAFAVDKCTDYNTTICSWATDEFVRSTFGRQAIPMTWDYCESNVFSASTGNFIAMLEWVCEALALVPACDLGMSQQSDAQTQTISQDKVISTDPPYYDNIGYADLSDFFYVWMRRNLKGIYPELFSTIAVPKAEELVATPYRHGGREAAEMFFLDGMTATMRNLCHQAHPCFPVTIYYAFKQSATDESGTSNTGWETFLDAIISAGFSIGGTWPMRTERGGRMIGNGTNALASSIVLVCRKRPEDAAEVSRGEFARELRSVMFDALRDMTGTERLDETVADIAPVDLAQAAIGPGMAVYSKYKAVLKSDGSRLSVHEAIVEINKEIERVLDPDNATYDNATNFFVAWYREYGFGDGEFGKADVLARAKGTSVPHLVASDVAVSSGGRFRILHWKEYPGSEGYDPAKDSNLPLWEALHRVIRELMTASTRKAAKLIHAMGRRVSADDLRQLAYYLYTWCERKGDAA